MVTRNVSNEVVVLYDRLHELYVDSIKFQDACSMNEGVEHISKLYNVMDSVNKCMTEMAFGGMGLIEFIDDVNLNDLYMNVLLIASLIASEVQNAVVDKADSNDDLFKLHQKIRTNVNKIHAIIQDIMQILVEVFNV